MKGSWVRVSFPAYIWLMGVRCLWNMKMPGFFWVCMDVVEGRQRKVVSLGGCSRGCFWGFVRRMERDARGRWHRSGQGLRRGILLGLRETAKSIAAGPELAFGSDSRPCRNNAVSRSPSSNHPSSAAARLDATFLWLTLPADRKKTEQVTEADWASCPEMLDWYRIFL